MDLLSDVHYIIHKAGSTVASSCTVTVDHVDCDGKDCCDPIHHKCGINEGVCGSDADCMDNLICGVNNCIGSQYAIDDDCCTEILPEPIHGGWSEWSWNPCGSGDAVKRWSRTCDNPEPAGGIQCLGSNVTNQESQRVEYCNGGELELLGTFGDVPNPDKVMDDAAFYQSEKKPITGFRVLTENWLCLRALQFRYGDDWGGIAGDFQTPFTEVLFEDGEVIDYLYMRYGSHIDGIRFRTNLGREFGFYGKESGAVTEHDLEDNCYLAYISGGHHYIGGISCTRRLLVYVHCDP